MLTAATLRPGASAITVNLTNGNSAVGTLGASSLTINAGSAVTTFQPATAGTDAVSIAATPSGYSTPAANQSTTYTVTAPSITSASVSVGQNLEATITGMALGVAAPAGGETVTITSPDATQIVLSTSSSTLGSGSLSFTLSQGQTQIPAFYVQALGAPGTVQNPNVLNLAITAPGYNSTTAPVTLLPSGFVFQTSNFSMSVSATAQTLTIQPAMLNAQFLTSSAVQSIRPGLTNLAVTVTLSDQSGTSPVGSITVNPVTFAGTSTTSVTTSFQPLHLGSTILGLTSPGFTTSSSQVTATVTP